MSNIYTARLISRLAHKGQKYGGYDYFERHVMDVVRRVEADRWAMFGHITVAYLHDVVEDSDVSLKDLRDAGFDTFTVNSVDALTRREGQTYMEYIDNLTSQATAPFAALVKLRDLESNIEATREEASLALDPHENHKGLGRAGAFEHINVEKVTLGSADQVVMRNTRSRLLRYRKAQDKILASLRSRGYDYSNQEETA